MQAWHKNYVQTGNIVLAVAGDFGGKERLEKELNNAFGSWEPTYTAYPKIPLPQPVMERKIFHIQKESAQAYIALVKPAPERGSKHEYALTVTNEILGGGLSSRLAAEVRSRRGLAYTVYSYAGKRELLGFEFTFCSTKPETYSQALETMLEQFKLIRQEKTSEEEINRAEAAITNSFVFRFPTPYSLITNRMTLDYYGYPKDYLKNYVQNIEKIAAGDVLQISKNMLNPDDMMIFVIGDASKFDKPLSTFGKVTELKEED